MYGKYIKYSYIKYEYKVQNNIKYDWKSWILGNILFKSCAVLNYKFFIILEL